MRFGFDFDNTIVSYDALFHKVACEQGVIPEDTEKQKNAVRDYLRGAGKEDVWTEMQGHVYGERMDEAEAYPLVREVLEALRDDGHELFIISHKTKHPFAGPKHDLHKAARSWIETHLCDEDGEPLISEDQVYFHETKDEKVVRIGELDCWIFLDDLPEILLHEAFPEGVRRVLFAPAGAEATEEYDTVGGWDGFVGLLTAE